MYEVISSEDEEDSQYKAKQAAIFPYAANVHRAARNNYFKNCHGTAIMPPRTHSNIALQEAQAFADLDGLLSDDDLLESLSSGSSDWNYKLFMDIEPLKLRRNRKLTLPKLSPMSKRPILKVPT